MYESLNALINGTVSDAHTRSAIKVSESQIFWKSSGFLGRRFNYLATVLDDVVCNGKTID